MKTTRTLITVSTVLILVILMVKCQPAVVPPIDTAAVATYVYHSQPTLRTQTFDIEVSKPGYVRPMPNGPLLKGIPTDLKNGVNYTSAIPQCRYNTKTDRYSIITYFYNKTSKLNEHSVLFFNAYSNSSTGLTKPKKLLLPLISDNVIYSYDLLGPDKSIMYLWLMTCVNSSVPQNTCKDSSGTSYYRPDLYRFNFNTGALSGSSYVPEPGKIDSRKLPKYNLKLSTHSSSYYVPDPNGGRAQFMLMQSAGGNNPPSSTNFPKQGETVLISYRYDYGSGGSNIPAYSSDFYNLGNLNLKQFVVASDFRLYGIIRDPTNSNDYNSELRIADFPLIRQFYYPNPIADFFAPYPRLDLSAYTEFQSMTFSWWNSQIVVLAVKRSTGPGVLASRVVLFIDVKTWDQASSWDAPTINEYRYSTIDNSNNDFSFACVAVNKGDKSRVY